MTEVVQRPVSPPNLKEDMLRGAQTELISALQTLGGPTGGEVWEEQIQRFLTAELNWVRQSRGEQSEEAMLLARAVNDMGTVEGRGIAIGVFQRKREGLEPFLADPEISSEETKRQARAFEASIELLNRPLPEQSSKARGKGKR